MPVEVVFDQGIGDLFVIRVAGNVCDFTQLGTTKYGVEPLGSRLCVVMGHTKCGAVVGAIYDIETGKVAFLGPHPKNDELVKESGETQTMLRKSPFGVLRR